MIFKFGQYNVDVDTERTRAFYRTAPRVTETCGCDGCRNFERAADELPDAVGMFFDRLGADLKKVCECYVNGPTEDGMLLYGGFCHLCGSLVSGGSTSVWQDGAAYPVTETFRVSVQQNTDLLEDGFPQPAVQMEFSAKIPWLLDRENPYLEKTDRLSNLQKGKTR